jgi:hypothetical protein
VPLAILDDLIDHATGHAPAVGPSALTLGVLRAAESMIVHGAAQRFQVLCPAPIVRVVERTNTELPALLRLRSLDLLLARLADAALMFEL